MFQNSSPAGCKKANVEEAPVELRLDSQTVLGLFVALPLKIGLIAHKPFKVNLLIVHKIQGFKSYGRLMKLISATQNRAISGRTNRTYSRL